MKTGIIRSIIDKNNEVLSLGYYWNSKGVFESFEYIGDEVNLIVLINKMKDDDCDFMHVIEREI